MEDDFLCFEGETFEAYDLRAFFLEQWMDSPLSFDTPKTYSIPTRFIVSLKTIYVDTQPTLSIDNVTLSISNIFSAVNVLTKPSGGSGISGISIIERINEVECGYSVTRSSKSVMESSNTSRLSLSNNNSVYKITVEY